MNTTIHDVDNANDTVMYLFESQPTVSFEELQYWVNRHSPSIEVVRHVLVQRYPNLATQSATVEILAAYLCGAISLDCSGATIRNWLNEVQRPSLTSYIRYVNQINDVTKQHMMLQAGLERFGSGLSTPTVGDVLIEIQFELDASSDELIALLASGEGTMAYAKALLQGRRLLTAQDIETLNALVSDGLVAKLLEVHIQEHKGRESYTGKLLRRQLEANQVEYVDVLEGIPASVLFALMYDGVAMLSDGMVQHLESLMGEPVNPNVFHYGLRVAMAAATNGVALADLFTHLNMSESNIDRMLSGRIAVSDEMAAHIADLVGDSSLADTSDAKLALHEVGLAFVDYLDTHNVTVQMVTKALGFARTTVRNWVIGAFAIPEKKLAQIEALVGEPAYALRALMEY